MNQSSHSQKSTKEFLCKTTYYSLRKANFCPTYLRVEEERTLLSCEAVHDFDF